MTDANRSRQDMSAHVAIKKGDCQPELQTTVSRASHWTQNYVDQNPQTEAAREACSIIYGLKALRPRPAVDELLGLIGEIAKSDQGLEEITRQKAG